MKAADIIPLLVMAAANTDLAGPLCQLILQATPAPAIDWLAVHWVASERIRLPLNRAERIEVVRRLVGKLSGTEIGALIGVTDRTVERYKDELRTAGWELVAS